jgi:hypothetical protein
MVKAGVITTRKSQGHEILTFTEGGLLIEAALGGQKFYFKPAVLTQGKPDKQEHSAEQSGKSDSSPVAGDQQEKDQHGGNRKGSEPRKIGRFDVEVIH